MDRVVGGKTASSFSPPRLSPPSPVQPRKPQPQETPKLSNFSCGPTGERLIDFINQWVYRISGARWGSGLFPSRCSSGSIRPTCSCWTMPRCLPTCVSLHITGSGWRGIKCRIAALKRKDKISVDNGYTRDSCRFFFRNIYFVFT